MVSVSMITYKHSLYIAQAIEGVLMQKTNFEFVLVLADDCSPDTTPQLIDEIIHNHPKGYRIKYYRHEKNIGMMSNFVFSIQKCTNKYIAFCEGDDYWTDPLKLQKQVDLLEANPELVACHHWQKIAVSKGDSFEEIEAPKEGHGYFPFETGVKSIFENKMRVKARTVMFRNVFKPSEITLNFPKAAFGDVPLSFVLGKYGKFGFLDEDMAVYRQTNSGVSTEGLEALGRKKFQVQHFKNWIQIWDYADRFYGFEYHKEASKTVIEYYQTITANLPKTIGSFIKVLYYNIFKRKLPFRRKISSSKWIILYYRKKLGYKLKRKLTTS